ncbi:MAG: methyltransferase domain-containing protein [Ktedonobacteraceae bacterium]
MGNIKEELARYPLDVENVEEMERLIKQAHLISEHVGLLPSQILLMPGQMVLDIGCGPGEWVLEMARNHPSCQIMGIDISPHMVAYARACAHVRRLPNTVFEITDACEPMPFADNSFDVIHARFVTAFLQVSTWPIFLKECFRVLRPGGTLYSTEFDSFGITTSPALIRYNDIIVEYLRRGQHCFTEDGSNVGVIAMQAYLLQKSGFTSIQQTMHVLNYSLGNPVHLQMIENYSALMQLMQPVIIREEMSSQEELDLLYTQAMTETHAEGFCAVTMFQTVWGRKPS